MALREINPRQVPSDAECGRARKMSHGCPLAATTDETNASMTAAVEDEENQTRLFYKAKRRLFVTESKEAAAAKPCRGWYPAVPSDAAYGRAQKSSRAAAPSNAECGRVQQTSQGWFSAVPSDAAYGRARKSSRGRFPAAAPSNSEHDRARKKSQGCRLPATSNAVFRAFSTSSADDKQSNSRIVSEAKRSLVYTNSISNVQPTAPAKPLKSILKVRKAPEVVESLPATTSDVTKQLSTARYDTATVEAWLASKRENSDKIHVEAKFVVAAINALNMFTHESGEARTRRRVEAAHCLLLHMRPCDESEHERSTSLFGKLRHSILYAHAKAIIENYDATSCVGDQRSSAMSTSQHADRERQGHLHADLKAIMDNYE